MANTSFPITGLFFSFMTAILVLDLRHDYCSDINLVQSYYLGVENAPLIFHLVIPIVIVILSISLIINIFRFFRIYDIITMILNIPCLYIFLNILIPNQNQLKLTSVNDSAIFTYVEVNKYWHLVLLIINIVSILLQVLATRTNGKEKTK